MVTDGPWTVILIVDLFIFSFLFGGGLYVRSTHGILAIKRVFAKMPPKQKRNTMDYKLSLFLKIVFVTTLLIAIVSIIALIIFF
ncbi:MAG: hypothetical protein A3F51_02275 [Candidatus Taylorbacteria bacterium RIFCSPHIGHO2_12_FULL_45_16]|uniref:Uncharacterized protein n=1 Tax=Candidatus Taylorbacteria bacterium RIFCSPHIGHO2_12_FULL_45_16 TaxID=1802315 RepID=A0A1G2MXY3_9BACT|nr:MAG: hypothetical protein A3F51_02275 [Candidatus Taylorbacteria bacterium RIFCSPHIGHO2_12_FULL_45_16]OHA32845.1 MAG: hypothetical protein A3A23_03075 [Candidatus Taylorbacteria bacterium RIFCSPLOWO2_01_FULL_45_59]OHA38232.1 MAG: hypothetical protein A3I98_02805 [Candidatus Taylorbacteria bacterium RIFCSPLOWO2_02_FULL_45_10b]OHA43956.1 MAG: hypothetical protein A3G04_01000 [Candidatus Taylorbacteria bacterium RIFCSPLOWO2_12_FULL_44_9]